MKGRSWSELFKDMLNKTAYAYKIPIMQWSCDCTIKFPFLQHATMLTLQALY